MTGDVCLHVCVFARVCVCVLEERERELERSSNGGMWHRKIVPAIHSSCVFLPSFPTVPLSNNLLFKYQTGRPEEEDMMHIDSEELFVLLSHTNKQKNPAKHFNHIRSFCQI